MWPGELHDNTKKLYKDLDVYSLYQFLLNHYSSIMRGPTLVNLSNPNHFIKPQSLTKYCGKRKQPFGMK